MIKKLLLITLLVSSLFAEIEWMKYDDAMIKAKKENKIVMVMLSKKGCGACDFMENIVLEDEKVISEFTNGFIGVHIDVQEDLIPNGLDYIGTPTFHFINAKGTKIDTIIGGKKVENFIKKLKEVKAQ
ncbi:MAG: thioredoxin family protein [Sulfurimonas sp.]|jgi:thioredoxin-related protein